MSKSMVCCLGGFALAVLCGVALESYLSFFCVFGVFAVIALALGKQEDEDKARAYNAIVQAAHEKLLKEENFSISREFALAGDVRFLVDDTSKRIAALNDKGAIFVGYDKLLGMRLIEDNHTIFEGSMGEALTGAAFGHLLGNSTTGAIIGSCAREVEGRDVCDELRLVLELDNVKSPTVDMYICVSCERSSEEYARARRTAEDLSALYKIIQRQQAGGDLPKGSIRSYESELQSQENDEQ